MKTNIVLSICLLGLAFCMSSHAFLGDNKKPAPNVVLVVLDDLGYSDLSSFGSDINTQSIDSLAQDGVRYSNFHATPTCSPSRAALLTGREPHRVGMGLVSRFDFGERFPAFRGRISENAVTMAELLAAQDYGTYGVGKWHLLPPSHMKPSGPFTHWPSGKGFQRFYGFLAGSTDQFKPELFEDNRFVEREFEEDYILTKDLMDKAIKMLHNHVSYSPERPFFMYLSTPGMHAPHQASKKYLEKYRGQFDHGWDEEILKRLKKQEAMGLLAKGIKLPEKDERVKSWKSLSEQERRVYTRLQEVYAAFLEETDAELGRFFDQLKELDQYDNTIVVLLSDNGASQEGDVNGNINHSSHYGGNIETVADIAERIDDIGGPRAASNYPLGWAASSNTPFRYFKQETYSGGINVPLIIKPAKSQSKSVKANSIRHQYHYISDILPTIMDYLEIDLPSKFEGKEQMPFDGMSMRYSLEKPDANSRRTRQFYRMGYHQGIYDEGWSAVYRYSQDEADEPEWRLFNLTDDIAQANNLAEQYPQKLADMKKLWKQEGKKLNADELPSPTALKMLRAARQLFAPDTKAKTHHFYPQASYVVEKSAPQIVGRSFGISVDIQSGAKESNGVLFTYGNRDSGLIVYMDKGVPVFEYNYFDNIASFGKQSRILANQAITEESAQLRVQFQHNKDNSADVEMVLDGKTIGAVHIPKTIKGRLSHEGASIAREWAVSVSDHPSARMPFSGKLKKVEVNVL